VYMHVYSILYYSNVILCQQMSDAPSILTPTSSESISKVVT
jgi:hypothetical protein